MQRIISLQTSRNTDRGSSEFVTKRLCCSFLFSVAFLSLLGGFLLGRYATDRAILLKNVAMQQKQQTEEHLSIEVMQNLSSLVHGINDSIREVEAHIPDADLKTYYLKLNCTGMNNVDTSIYESNRNHIILKTSKILNLHLNALNTCFTDIYLYLDELHRRYKSLIVTATTD